MIGRLALERIYLHHVAGQLAAYSDLKSSLYNYLDGMSKCHPGGLLTMEQLGLQATQTHSSNCLLMFLLKILRLWHAHQKGRRLHQIGIPYPHTLGCSAAIFSPGPTEVLHP